MNQLNNIPDEQIEQALSTIGNNIEETGSINPKDVTQEDAQIFYSFAHQLYQTGEYEKAEPIFRKLCISRPLEARNWMGLAASLQEQAKYDIAVVAWSMVCFMQNDYAKAHFHAAECLVSLNNLDDAQSALNACKEHAKNDESLLNRIEALEESVNSRKLNLQVQD
ncbi:MAG: tetratricopeptide repeat protein [Rhabdochlamydiaceae bacterium]|nr:tetratricopeptide repeat protein [Candidatus Amphrikana amoebophyrae]